MSQGRLVGRVLFAALLSGCYQDFPCADTAQCRSRFGDQSICEERTPGFGLHCYTSAPPDMTTTSNTSPRTCDKGELVRPKNVIMKANYGATLAVSGTNVLVGAPSYLSSGYAEIVDAAQPGRPAQQVLDTTGGTRAGYGVALSGQTALVLDRFKTYFFKQQGTAWSQVTSQMAPSSETNGNFDQGAALADGYAFAQSFGTVSAQTQYNAVFYQFDGTSATCGNTVFPPMLIQHFGSSLAANDRFLAIGARGDTSFAKSQVCLFDYRAASCPTNPPCMGLTTGSPPPVSFGATVALSGSHLVVGAPAQTDAMRPPFFSFEYDGSAWKASGDPDSLPASDADFGTSLAIADDLLIVGAPAAGNSQGTARVYQWLDKQWNFVTALEPPKDVDAATFDLTNAPAFGSAVGVSGDLIAVGISGAKVQSQDSAGAVALYRCPPTQK